MEQIAVELYGYLKKFGLAFMGEPGVGDIGPDKDQLQVFNFFHAVPDDAFDPFGIFDKIQLVFLMVVYGKVERCLMSGEHREAIGLFQRDSLF